MGVYSEYLDMGMSFDQMCSERKKQLKRIASLRHRDILVYASDITKNAPNSIDYTDIMAVSDQLSNMSGDSIDIILETPGGYAEVAEDLVNLIRNKYEKVGIIIPGSAKSAGTIFAMAGDEILMGKTSALGPIDAQIKFNGKQFSADALLQGLEKIKSEVTRTKSLNAAYIPMLQNLSPGEIQHSENAQNFSQKLVSEWLIKYKFKYWETHSSTGNPVTEEDKKQRAKEIAKKLCNHSDWLTHGRSIRIDDLQKMKLLVTNYDENPELSDAIIRYYTLLRMSFDANIYKLFETCNTQIYRLLSLNPGQNQTQNADNVVIEFQCSKCNTKSKIQANLKKGIPIQAGFFEYPVSDNIFKCPNCGIENNLIQIRTQIEAQTKKTIV